MANHLSMRGVRVRTLAANDDRGASLGGGRRGRHIGLATAAGATEDGRCDRSAELDVMELARCLPSNSFITMSADWGGASGLAISPNGTWTFAPST